MAYRDIDVTELVEENERLKFLNETRKDKLRFYLKWFKVFFRSKGKMTTKPPKKRRLLGEVLNDSLLWLIAMFLSIFVRVDERDGEIHVTTISGLLLVTGFIFGIGYLITHPANCASEPFRAGYVVRKEYHEAYTTTVCAGSKPMICTPHHHPERFEVVFSDGERNNSENVLESDWHNYHLGQWVCLTPGNCPGPRDDDPMDHLTVQTVD